MPKPCVTLEHVLSQNSILSVLIQCEGRSSIRIPDLVIVAWTKRICEEADLRTERKST